MALLSNAIEPQHLRVALGDEDPDIRLLAARHPKMTPELLREVLGGHDTWLAEQVLLERPDLRPEELEVAMQNPELLPTAIRHPGASEEQRMRVHDDTQTPEGLREDIRSTLVKNVGFVTFPGLGEAEPRSTSLLVSDRKSMENRRRLYGLGPRPNTTGSTLFTNADKNPTPERRRRLSIVAVKERRGENFDNASRKRIFGSELPSEGSVGNQINVTRAVVAGKRLGATDSHETQHGILARLKQRYGGDAVRGVLHHLWESVGHEHRENADRLFRGSGVASKYPESDANEEKLARLLDYLQDPIYRRQVHVRLRIAQNQREQRQLFHDARRAWQHLRLKASALKPSDFGLKFQKTEDSISAWVDSLRKARDTQTFLEDHLGQNVLDADIAAALSFLGISVDPKIYRSRLLETEDPREAAAQAANLSPEDRQALDAVLKLFELRKNTGIPEVQAGPGNKKWAELLRDAWVRGEVEPIKLGGKHSSGSMLARDEDGFLFLVKPGSGKQSPAAGARQESASQSAREAAFSQVAWALGIEQVPPADLVFVDGKPTAVLQMVGLDFRGLHRAQSQDKNLAVKALEPYRQSGELHAWALLDYVFGNTDRHGQNILVGPAPKNEIALIDHGSAFAGPDFDPGHDRNSFVPYYLRAWSRNWNRLSTAEKLAAMPTCNGEADHALREWVEDVASRQDEIRDILLRYGINPEPSLNRLRDISDAVAASVGLLTPNGVGKIQKASEVINGFWVR